MSDLNFYWRMGNYGIRAVPKDAMEQFKEMMHDASMVGATDND